MGQIDVSWNRFPMGDFNTRQTTGTSYNLLLLPWPLDVADGDFQLCPEPIMEIADHFGFFEYKPDRSLDLTYVESALEEALTQVPTVDSLSFPEAPIFPEEVGRLESIATRHGVDFLVAGVRRPHGRGQLGDNYAHIGMFHQDRWHRMRINKHHRWNLDESQIRQYGLNSNLDPGKSWWEAIRIPVREMQHRRRGRWNHHRGCDL